MCGELGWQVQGHIEAWAHVYICSRFGQSRVIEERKHISLSRTIHCFCRTASQFARRFWCCHFTA